MSPENTAMATCLSKNRVYLCSTVPQDLLLSCSGGDLVLKDPSVHHITASAVSLPVCKALRCSCALKTVTLPYYQHNQ